MSELVKKLADGLREEAQIDPFVHGLVGRLRQVAAELAHAAHEPEGAIAGTLVEAIKAMSADRARLTDLALGGMEARRLAGQIAPLLRAAASIDPHKADFRAGQWCGDDSLPLAGELAKDSPIPLPGVMVVGGLAVLDKPRPEPRALALDWVPFDDGGGAFALVGFTRLIAGPKGAWAIVGHGSGVVEGGGLLDAQLAAEAAAKEVLAADFGMLRLVSGAWWRPGPRCDDAEAVLDHGRPRQ